MNVRQRRKLFAGAGMITMLFGALMVLAPTGALANHTSPTPYGVYGMEVERGANVTPNLDCADMNDGSIWNVRDDSQDDAPLNFGVLSNVAGVNVTVVPGDPLHLNWTSENPVGVVIVKQAIYSAVFHVGSATSGTVYAAVAPGSDMSTATYSHVTFCGPTPTTQPQTGSFTIDKVLAGGDLKPAEDTPFSIEISCSNGATPINLNGDEAGDAVTVQVKPNDNPVWNSSSLGVPLPVNATCLVEETPVPTGSTVSYKIGAATATPNNDGQITVTIASTPQAVEVTNTYDSQPGTGGLTVSKVAGVNAPTTTPAPQFTFTVDCDVNGTAVDPDSTTTGNQETFQLTFGQSKSFSGLDVNATCDVKETGKGTATSTTHKVNTGAVVNSDTASDVAITLDQVAAVAFTNNYSSGGGGGGCVENPATEGPDCDFIPPLGCVDNAATPQNECVPDACPNVDGIQAAGTNCNPVTDACPLIPGTQRLPASCIEVLPEQTERPPVVTPPAPTPPVDTPPPAVAPERQERPEVKGDVVSRTLPRTGNESRDLAAFGGGLLLLGAGLVLTSRSRFARVD